MQSCARLRSAGRATLLAALGWLSLGCDKASEEVSLAKLKPENGGISVEKDDFSHVPVPPEDGPKLAPVAMVVPIRATPSPSAPVIGYLRVGSKVSRSEQPVTRRDCPDGWYAVRPVGFVCAGPDVTTKLDHPVVRAIDVEPDRRKPMPYKYAFLRAIAPNYLKVPTKAEQLQYEMGLERHLRNYEKLKDRWDALDVGANDVPLDEAGMAIGAIPDHAIPMNLSERFGGNNDDRVPWWLAGTRRIPNLSSFKAPPYAVIAGRVKRHAGVALIGSFVPGPEAGERRFAITTDGRLLPTDKLKADSGSPFHGYDISKLGLPVAFTRHDKAYFYRFRGGSFEKDARANQRQFVPLTGSVKQFRGERWVETRDGRWLKSAELRTIAKPSTLPPWARKGTKWIDISILNQTLTLWEGDRPMYATLVSTGRDGLGEPGKTLSTPTGQFRVYQKHVTTTMDSDVADHEFELRDVPWVMYFKGGYAIHGAYWHDDFGRPRSHGCVNLAPIDARYVFFWASPSVPEHWHGAYAVEPLETGTLINIHP